MPLPEVFLIGFLLGAVFAIAVIMVIMNHYVDSNGKVKRHDKE